jgi:solute carrier family 13 (sodium-dependent dicarboxylate transporter), member 2/3/5
MRKIFFALVLAVLAYFLAHFGLNEIQARLVGLIVLLVTLWSNEGLPLGVTSLLPIILFPLSEVLSTGETTGNYSKSIIFLFLGGFFLGLAVEKTNLHREIIQRMFSIFPYTPTGVILSLAITAAVLSALLSNTTTTLLMIPLALGITDISRLKMRFVLAIAYGATIGGIMTPIGTPPNLILLGFMEEKGMAIVPFFQWMTMTIPLAIAMLLCMGFILSYGMANFSLDIPLGKANSLTYQQKKLVAILSALGLLLILNSPIEPYYSGLGLNEKLILLGAGLILFFPKFDFLTWEDTRKTPYEILFLFGSGFAIAKAVSTTHLDHKIVEFLMGVSTFPSIIFILVIAILVTFGTEFTSNMALTTIAIPILYVLVTELGLSPRLYMMVATICASYAFMLPIATAPNAIAMASGAVKVRDMVRYGFFLNLLGIGLTTLVAYFYW